MYYEQRLKGPQSREAVWGLMAAVRDILRRRCVRALVHVPFVHLFLFPFPLFLPYFLFPPFRLSDSPRRRKPI